MGRVITGSQLYNVEAGDIDLLTYLKDQSVFDIEDGNVRASTGVGFGIEIDEDVIRKIAKGTDPWKCRSSIGLMDPSRNGRDRHTEAGA